MVNVNPGNRELLTGLFQKCYSTSGRQIHSKFATKLREHVICCSFSWLFERRHFIEEQVVLYTKFDYVFIFANRYFALEPFGHDKSHAERLRAPQDCSAGSCKHLAGELEGAALDLDIKADMMGTDPINYIHVHLYFTVLYLETPGLDDKRT